MKKLFLIAFTLLITSQAHATLNNLMPAQALANWQAMCTEPKDEYCTLLEDYYDVFEVPPRDEYHQKGMMGAILYKVTGNTSYATTAFSAWTRGCYYPPPGTSDYVRDQYPECAMVFSMIGDAIGSSNKAAGLDVLLNMYNYTINCTSGGDWCLSGRADYRNYQDVDQTIGAYFGAQLHARMIQNENPTLYSQMIAKLGLVDNGTVYLRNVISNLSEINLDGSYPDGSEYNNAELGEYIGMSVAMLSASYGTDHFPEYTSHFTDIGNYILASITPDFSETLNFGDVQNGGLPIHYQTFYPALMSAAYNTTDDLQKNLRFVQNLLSSSVSGRTFNNTPLLFLSRTPAVNPSGIKYFDARKQGISAWKSGFEDTDSMAIIINRNYKGQDHTFEANRTFRLWRKGQWYINDPSGYDGSPHTGGARYESGFLVYGILPWNNQEFMNVVATKQYSDGMYSAMVAGGHTSLYYASANCPPETIKEWTTQEMYRHNADGSDTFIIFDRLKALDPSPYYGQWGSCGGAHTGQPEGIMSSLTADHQWTMWTPADSEPSDTAGRITFTKNSETVYLDTKISSYTFTTALAPDLGGPNGQYTKNSLYSDLRRIVLQIPNNDNFNTYLNFVHVGSAPTTTKISSNAGEAAIGAYYEAGSENVLAVFSAKSPIYPAPTEPTNDNGTLKYFPDADKLNVVNALRWFGTSTSIPITVDGNFILRAYDLNPAYSWQYKLDSGTAVDLAVNSEGVANSITVTASSGAHTLTILKSGGAVLNPCASSCTSCDSTNCVSVGPSCYLWGNNTCNATAEPASCDPTHLHLCTTSIDCTAVGHANYCDDDGDNTFTCQSTACTTPQALNENNTNCKFMYNFSETSGDLLDRCATDSVDDNGTVSGATRDGSEYTFDGTNDYVSVATSAENNFSTGSFTVCGKFRFVSLTNDTYNYLWGKGNGGTGGIRYTFYRTAASKEFTADLDDDINRSFARWSNSLATTSTTYACAVRDTTNNKVRVYENGTLRAEAADLTEDISGQNSRSFIIGAYCDSTSCPATHYSNVIFDDLFAVSGVVTPSQMQDWITNGGITETGTPSTPSSLRKQIYTGGSVSYGSF